MAREPVSSNSYDTEKGWSESQMARRRNFYPRSSLTRAGDLEMDEDGSLGSYDRFRRNNPKRARQLSRRLSKLEEAFGREYEPYR